MNITKYKIDIHFYLLKQTVCTLEGHKTILIDTEYEI